MNINLALIIGFILLAPSLIMISMIFSGLKYQEELERLTLLVATKNAEISDLKSRLTRKPKKKIIKED